VGKQSGLGDNFFLQGVDCTFDIASIDTLSTPLSLIEGTSIKQFAEARIAGKRDMASFAFSAFADVNAGVPSVAMAAMESLPRTDVLGSYFHGSAIGNIAFSSIGKQLNWDPTIDTSGSILFKAELQGNAFGGDWGEQVTPGIRTDTAATNGASIDDSASATTPSVPLSGTPVANTSPLPATVVVSAGTGTNVAINGVPQGTFDGTYVVPPNGGTITLTYTVAPTWTWTYQTTNGATCYLQAFAPFAGSTATVTVQSAPDNATWTTVVAFTAVTAAPAAQRLFTGTGVTIGKWLRVITTGTFTSFPFAVMVARYNTLVTF
jgi:hypothetical protein